MDRELVQKVHDCTTNLLNLNELDEKVMRQKTKIEWLKLGDKNNSYFHASLKAKQAAKGMHILYMDDGIVIKIQGEIEQTDIEFYEGLTGTVDRHLNHVDSVALRGGPKLTMEQRESLIQPVNDNEVETTLKGIRGPKIAWD